MQDHDRLLQLAENFWQLPMNDSYDCENWYICYDVY